MVDSAWVALSLVDHVGSKKLRALVARFGSAAAVLRENADSLRRVPGIGAKIAAGIRAVDLAAVERSIPRWRAAGIQLITLDDPAYPRRLRALDDAPPTLFVLGVWDARMLAAGAVAIVGTRSPSLQAIGAAETLAAHFAARAVPIVSGLARGIDKIAHTHALAFPSGYTLAVLGGGVLNVYPPEHKTWAQAISGRGALLCETHPYAEPKPTYLVARNRIITGLCETVIVVETGVDGGAMHAARRALGQGRRLYTLDLPASGNRALLDLGAQPLDPCDPVSGLAGDGL